ncbi:MAG: glycosyltransferase [Gammaproteobacteria bacterium]|nr:MAG: glycosyltransferase [Gammaproteobacteria bacterium]
MKISHLIVSLNRGGQERVVVDLAAQQVKNGLDVCIICLNEEGALAMEAREKDITIYNCNKKSAIDVKAIIKLRKILKSNNISILHTHNAVANYYGVAAKLGSHIKCQINTRHGNGATQGRMVERLFKLSMFFTELCVCVSESAKKAFLNAKVLSEFNSTVIYNGIHVNNEPPDKIEQQIAFKKLGFNKNVNVIGSVGRLSPAKDFPLLVESFAKIDNSLNTILVILGEGPERKNIEQAISNNRLENKVFLLGDRSDARELMSGFDIYAVSSATEGFSIAILEACAAALPIVATDVGGNPEIVKAGINGLLVQHGNSSALAKQLEHFLLNPELALNMGLSGFEWVAQTCSVAIMETAYMNVYRRHL